MSAPRPRHVALRIASGSLIALAAALVACESRLPTSVDVDRMTVGAAEHNAVRAGFMSPEDSLRTYYIDGRLASAADARALSPARIASIAIDRDAGDPAKGSVRITTREATLGAPTRMSVSSRGSVLPALAFDSSRFAGVVFVDGKRVNNAALAHLAPADIQSIEVLKGPRATELYPSEPAAAQGVIQITTKSGAAHK